ncbi:hypothetical protein [Marmoricola sp. OAE513]|uniref:hypothetical protein n=1 Tax=Marmoricola sp. OAE513 TaxID=2817894 RepID=UPI001AE376B3
MFSVVLVVLMVLVAVGWWLAAEVVPSRRAGSEPVDTEESERPDVGTMGVAGRPGRPM